MKEVHLDPCTLRSFVSIDSGHRWVTPVPTDVVREIWHRHREISGRSFFPLITKVDSVSPNDWEARFPGNIETSSADDGVEINDLATFQLNSLRYNPLDTFKDDSDVFLSQCFQISYSWGGSSCEGQQRLVYITVECQLTCIRLQTSVSCFRSSHGVQPTAPASVL